MVEVRAPRMQTERDVRIVTNAALNEAVERATLQHRYDVCVDKGAMFDTNQLALKNLEGAIANAGYQANQTLPRMGQPDSFPIGWSPIRMH